MQDEELQAIYSDLESEYGAVTYEAWLALLVSRLRLMDQNFPNNQVDITKDDSSSSEQLREAFRSMAGDKVRFLHIDPIVH